MKRKVIYFSICMLFVFGNLVAGVSPSTAQTPQPPRPPIPPYQTPLNTQPGSPTEPSDATSIALGQPGLSYRYMQTYGEIQAPYIADTDHLNIPVGLFMDGSDNLFVIEEWGHRVLKYDSTPSIESVWGKAGDGAWVLGRNEDVLYGPRDVALDHNGNVWIADANRIVQYDPDGVYLQQLPVDPWASGEDNTHFNDVNGIAIDTAGRMFVSDNNNHRVQVYDLTSGSPVYSTTLGVTGVSSDDNSHFYQPWRIALDSLDRLYVADSGNGRVQQCAYAGGWSCITLDSGLKNPQGLAVDSNNNVFIADTDNNRIRKCSSGSCADFTTDTPRFTDLAVDSLGYVYGTAPDDYIVVQYDSTGKLVSPYLGVQGVPYLTDAYHYNIPLVSTDAENNILITEEWGHRLIKLDPDGNFLWSFGVAGVAGWDDDHLSSPMMVAADSKGQIYVPDRWSCRVKIISPDGDYIKTLGMGCGSGEDEFNPPFGVAVDKAGHIYVTDMGNQRVMIYDSTLQYIGQIGETGVCSPDNDHLCNPNSIAFDSAGNVYIADSGNRRIQVFNSRLQWRMTIGNGIEGQQFDQFAWPQRVVVDMQGKIYVSDAWNNRIQVFNSSGAYLTTIGGAWGTSSAQFITASSVAVDGEGNVYVSDSGNSRIQKYVPGVPGWKQVNINGFGNPLVDTLPSLAVFRDKLYAGSSNWASNEHHIFSTRTGTDWQEGSQDLQGGVSVLRAFRGMLYAGTWNGLLWSSLDGEHWTNIFTSPSGFGSLSQYRGELYAGTYSDHYEGAAIFKSADGVNWTPFVTNGNGDPRAGGVTSAATFKWFHYFGIGDWTGERGGRIWRTDGTNLKIVVGDGFGNPQNYAPGGLADLNGWLYASIYNPNSYQVWRSYTGNPSSWKMVFETGQGETGSKAHTGLIAYNNQLYLTTSNDWSGMNVYQSADGVHWNQIGFDGFGDSNNWHTEWSNSLAVFNGQLYVGMTNYGNGVEVWRWLGQPYAMPTAIDQILLPFITR